MIKLRLGEAAAMNEVMEKIMEQPFPATMTFKIARLAREIAKEIQTFEKSRLKIAEKYGKRNEFGQLDVSDSGQVSIPPEKIAECNREFSELIQTEIEINANKIPLSAFDNITLTPREMLAIESIIDEE